MNALNKAIYTKLQADTTLTGLLSSTTAIHNMQAPDGEILPYVVFNKQGGGDENLTHSRMKNYVYYIRGYARIELAAGNIDNAIDSVLHGHSLAVSGYANFWLVREDDIDLVENSPSGEQIYSVGGLYRIRLSG